MNNIHQIFGHYQYYLVGFLLRLMMKKKEIYFKIIQLVLKKLLKFKITRNQCNYILSFVLFLKSTKELFLKKTFHFQRVGQNKSCFLVKPKRNIIFIYLSWFLTRLEIITTFWKHRIRHCHSGWKCWNCWHH